MTGRQSDWPMRLMAAPTSRSMPQAGASDEKEGEQVLILKAMRHG